ncbi:MAG: glycerophosphodiester phosphodiesterase [Gammaproteobacteria bacterium]|nr:glycerophosphodiester phosphodiesterase [Gammaproteobacteria bacterium]
MKLSTTPPHTLAHRLVAHRGDSQNYPENTLSALQAALSAGARYIEFDVQFSADKVPIVIHDDKLRRTTGVKANIHQLTAAELAPLRASEPQRFGKQFKDEPIPTLENVLQLLAQWPDATAFVEIKQEAVAHFGTEAVARRMVAALAAHQHNCILISFDATVLQAARNAGMQRIGWVLSKWNNAARQQAEQLAPDMLFCNYKKIPERDVLWPGVWSWALYDIVDPAIALHWFTRGVKIIETWDVTAMLRDPRLQVSESTVQKPEKNND